MRVFVFSLLMGIFLLGFSSCAQQESSMLSTTTTNSSEESMKAYTDVQDSIAALNSNLMQQGTSRSFFSRLFNSICKVVVADCVGAFNGLINGDNVWNSATSSSVNAARKEAKPYLYELESEMSSRAVSKKSVQMTDLINTETNLDGLILADNTKKLTSIDSLGYYHNKIINDSFTENNDANYWFSLDDKELVEKINAEVIKIVPQSLNNNDIKTDATIKFCNFIGTAMSESTNAQELLNKTKKEYVNLSNSIDILAQYVEGMEKVSTQEEWDKYSKDIVRIISNSNLNDKQKESLKAGIVVGYASSKLWKDE